MKLGVIGDPVAHSRSPELHRAMLAEAGLEGSYAAIRVEAGTLARRLPELRAHGFLGLNVTTPLKEEAFALCARCDDAASVARAANTLWFDGEAVVGANTDGIGALAALRAALAATPSVTGRLPAASPAAGRGLVLLLGSGPTARAAAFALARAGLRLAVWSRTIARVRDLVSAVALATGAGDLFVVHAPRARTAGVDEAPWPAPGDVRAAVSTLPPGAALPPQLRSLLAFVPCVIDANYGARATLGGALGRGDVTGGDAMLAAQARASFDLWRARS